MVEAYPSNDKLLKGQEELPPAMRQCALVLHFREPVPEKRMGEFFRIRLSPQMQQGGEENYFIAEFGPDPWRRDPKCSLCRNRVELLSEDSYHCINRKCELHHRVCRIPKRGVIRCIVAPDFIVDPVGGEEIVEYDDGTTATLKTGPLVNRVVLLLDRRYSDTVLSQIKRCAFNLAELCFMPLKD